MTYISWALYVEGSSDASYLGIIIPRLITHLLLDLRGPPATVPEVAVEVFGHRGGKLTLDEMAKAICRASSAFYILFVHGDTGGRALADQLHFRTCALCESVNKECDFRLDRCVVVSPNKEIESWTLADADAIRATFGLSRNVELRNVPVKPGQVEAIHDPKALTSTLLADFSAGRRRRSGRWPYESIAQEQDIRKLLDVPSFFDFAEGLKHALRGLGHP